MNVFKSEVGRDTIRNNYNQILSAFPLNQIYVETAFGKTFVLEAGNPQNPAIVLLHGSCSNSAAWLGDIPALLERFHVYAVDILGEPGNSEENRLNINNDEYPRWLNDVLNGLNIDKAIIMGNSMGGWLSLHFATAFPNRTSALVLLAPSGIIPPKKSFMTQTADINSSPNGAAAVNESIMGDESIPKEVRDYMNLIMENFNPIIDPLPVLTDIQMHVLTMPILFVAGTNDITMDNEKAAERLLKHVPQAIVKLLDGSHVIMTAADTVIPFLIGER
jgi:pimeloyl-ACP methyl ester carboxylesterase